MEDVELSQSNGVKAPGMEGEVEVALTEAMEEGAEAATLLPLDEAAVEQEVVPELELAPSLVPLSGTPNARLKVEVGSPHNVTSNNALGITTTYTSYRVASSAAAATPDYPWSACKVQRRFRDFEQLHARLRKEGRGSFLPALPLKTVTMQDAARRLDDEFVKARAQALTRYLQAVVSHPVLARTPCLKVFLTWSGSLADCPAWQRSGTPHLLPGSDLRASLLTSAAAAPPGDEDAPQPGADGAAAAPDSMTHWLGQRMQVLRLSWKHEVMQNLSVTEEEQPWRMLRLLIAGLKEQMASLLRRAEGVLAASSDMAACLRQLAAGSRSIHNFEAGQKLVGHTSPLGRPTCRIASDAQKMAYHSVSVARASEQYAEKSQAVLAAWRTQLTLLPGAMDALMDAEEAFNTAQILTKELLEKEAKARADADDASNGSHHASPVAPADSCSVRGAELAALRRGIAVAKEEYSTIRGRNRRDFNLMRAEMQADSLRTIMNFAQLQQQHAALCEQKWRAMARMIEQEHRLGPRPAAAQ